MNDWSKSDWVIAWTITGFLLVAAVILIYFVPPEGLRAWLLP